MKSIIFDTNVLLRFLLNDIPVQAKKTERAVEKAKKGKQKIIIPQIVIFEIYFGLEKYYKLSKNEIIEKIEPLISAIYFTIQDQQIFKDSLELFKNNNIDFVDCFLVLKSKEYDAELFTFDKKLKKLGKNS